MNSNTLYEYLGSAVFVIYTDTSVDQPSRIEKLLEREDEIAEETAHRDDLRKLKSHSLLDILRSYVE